MKFRSMITMLAAVAFSVCPSVPSVSQPAPQGEKLSSAQLRSTMPNTTATSANGDWVIYNSSDGKVKIRFGTGPVDAGTYRYGDKDQWCIKFATALGGTEHCMLVYKDGNMCTSVENGAQSRWTLAPGNGAGM
jgi:hypothetical protein